MSGEVEWNGTHAVQQNKTEQKGTKLNGLKPKGIERNGLERSGTVYMQWNGTTVWNGTEQNGITRLREMLFCASCHRSAKRLLGLQLCHLTTWNSPHDPMPFDNCPSRIKRKAETDGNGTVYMQWNGTKEWNGTKWNRTTCLKEVV